MTNSYFWVGFIASLPLWNSFFYFGMSSAKLYCGFAFADQTQIILAILSMSNGIAFILFIGYFYTSVYRFYKNLTNQRIKNMNASVMTNANQGKETDQELRIWWTTVVLVGWTVIGWIPMLSMIAYQSITGNLPNVYWDMISYCMILASICGDSIIILVYDARWKSAVRRMAQTIKNKAFGSSFCNFK